jgi:ribonucleoside-diphosphate reductase beta chain
LPGTADEIKYINIDEKLHVVIFERIITELGFAKNRSESVYTLMREAVEEEIDWSVYAFGNILGFNSKNLDQYVKYRANLLLRKIQLEPLYTAQEYFINPYAYLEKMADSDKQGEVKSNFFEATVTNYVLPEHVDGWGDF